jgi:hypothetical protein
MDTARKKTINIMEENRKTMDHRKRMYKHGLREALKFEARTNHGTRYLQAILRSAKIGQKYTFLAHSIALQIDSKDGYVLEPSESITICFVKCKRKTGILRNTKDENQIWIYYTDEIPIYKKTSDMAFIPCILATSLMCCIIRGQGQTLDFDAGDHVKIIVRNDISAGLKYARLGYIISNIEIYKHIALRAPPAICTCFETKHEPQTTIATVKIESPGMYHVNFHAKIVSSKRMIVCFRMSDSMTKLECKISEKEELVNFVDIRAYDTESPNKNSVSVIIMAPHCCFTATDIQLIAFPVV